jgi:hypothetical protein
LKKDTNIPVRFTAKEKLIVEQRAKENWYKNLSSYIRARTLQPA